jgi:hypothetical protein
LYIRSSESSDLAPVHGTEGIPRFQPSAAALGAATAQQILDELRKQLEGVDLKKDAPKKRASKKS